MWKTKQKEEKNYIVSFIRKGSRRLGEHTWSLMPPYVYRPHFRGKTDREELHASPSGMVFDLWKFILKLSLFLINESDTLVVTYININFNFYSFLKFMYSWCIYIPCKCLVTSEARRGSDPLELKFQWWWATEWVLGIDPRCLESTARAFTIEPSLQPFIIVSF